jgi:hypothetical protein
VRRPLAAVIAVLMAATLFACGHSSSPTSPTSTTPSSSPPKVPGPSGYGDATLVGAGDIGWCGSAAPIATAKLLQQVPGAVFTAGDNAYMSGTMQQFENCYNPSWGADKARTHPAPGNHDHASGSSAPYFVYFGENAGPPGRGYYSYDLQAWHIVSLDSNQPSGEGSAEWTWLKQDLQSSTRPCTLAYWHHPLFSSGPHGPQVAVRDLWRLLYDAGAEIVVSAHDHLYERFAPQTPDGKADEARGIRQFTVGTGGAPLYDVRRLMPNSEFTAKEWGVLELTLTPTGYRWAFLSTAGGTLDSGQGDCH